MKTKQRYTEGPWEAETGSIIKKVFARQRGFGGLNGPELIAQICGDNDKANARLIASSPTLLETLKGFHDSIEYRKSEEDQVYWSKKAREAIAKAEG